MTPDQQELLRIPMSMSDPRGDMDRRGNPCVVVDAIINDNVMALAMRTRPLATFLTNLVIAWANEKVYAFACIYTFACICTFACMQSIVLVGRMTNTQCRMHL